MLADSLGDQHTPRLAELFQPRRDIDAIAKDVGPLGHYVAKIDPDPEHQPAFGRGGRLVCRNRLLDRRSALHGVDHRAELDQGTVTGDLDDAAAMSGEQGVDDLAA